MSTKKVIVTGGMGYIGSHTVIELIDKGYEPIIIDNLSNSNENVLNRIKRITGKTVVFEKIDLTEEVATFDSFNKHSDAIGVIHFAALKAVGESVQLPNKYYKNNINSLINVLEAMKSLHISNFIFSSSCTVYGQATDLPVTENTPTQKANSPYGFTKQIGERIIDDFVSITEDLNAISLRYFNPIGAHDSALIGELPNGIPNNLLPYLTQTVSGIREILSVFGGDYNTADGTAIRDYIHVVDLAKAHVKSIERLELNSQTDDHEYFNLGTGIGYTVLDVINAFQKSTGMKVNYQIVDRREGDIEAIYADTKKANDVLGWKAQLTLEDMTQSAWNWEMNLKKENLNS